MRKEDIKVATEQRLVWQKVLKGNVDAIHFVDTLGFITQVWDDLIDKDNAKLTANEINKAFWCALVEIPQNPFFILHHKEFIPLFRDYINAWLDANELEKTNKHGKTIAFVLRDLGSGIVHQCAYLIGGYDWMREVSLLIRDTIFDETIEEYMNKERSLL